MSLGGIGSVLQIMLGSMLDRILRADLGVCNEVYFTVLLNAA